MRKSKREIERQLADMDSSPEDVVDVHIVRRRVDENGDVIETTKSEMVEL